MPARLVLLGRKTVLYVWQFMINKPAGQFLNEFGVLFMSVFAGFGEFFE
jgi:hypothetical protein